MSSMRALIYGGNKFQTSGAAQLYARVILLLCIRGTTNWVVSLEDRCMRAAIRLTSSSDRYCGWCRLNAWNVGTTILNMMRFRTGSQCNVTRVSDSCEQYGSFTTALTSPFWSQCKMSNLNFWDSRQKSIVAVQSWKYDCTSNRQSHVHIEGWPDVFQCVEVIISCADYVVDAPVSCSFYQNR